MFAGFSTAVYAQLPWPFPVSNQQGTVTGSVGEYRFTRGQNRFHQGVDLTNGGNYAVHAISAGTVRWNGDETPEQSAVTVTTAGQDIVYYHIYPISGIADGTKQTVLANEKIGDMIVRANPSWPTHVHLEEQTTNFLHDKLFPYVDRGVPYFATTHIPNGVAFYRNGLLKTTSDTDLNNLLLSQTSTVSGTPFTSLYNKVDIVAHVIDPWVFPNGGTVPTAGWPNGMGQNVPSEISWSVSDFFTNTNLEFQALRFTGIPSNAAVLPSFHPLSHHPGNPSILTITSNPTVAPYDRFWNTGLATGQTETYAITSTNPPVTRPANLDAIANTEARYPDGPYRVTINANDVDYADNPNNAAQPRRVNVVVDNFRPYVKEVTVRKGGPNGRLVYRGTYDWNTTTRQLVFNSTTGDDMDPSSFVWIKIVTSEPCQNIQAHLSDETLFQNASVSNTNNTEFTYTHLPVVFPPLGTQTISIQGQDWAGHPLQTDPTSIPVRQSDGTWLPAPLEGVDTHHTFKTGNYVCTTNGPSNGRVAAGNRTAATTCVYADIASDKTSVNTSEPIIFSPVTSGSGLFTYSWDFGTGAAPAKSTSSGAQTVLYSTAGQKTISLQVCDQTGACQSAQKIIQVYDMTRGGALTVDFTASPTAANTGQTIQLTSAVLGASGNVSYLWTFDNGVSQGIFTDQNPVISYYDNSPGSKTISLTVTDDYGSVTTTKSGYLTIISPYFNLVPTIGGCITTGADRSVTFSNSVTGGSGNYTSYLWDFGDGSSSTSSAGLVQHTYKTSGKYTVRLTVCDNTGCGTAEQINCVTVPSTGNLNGIDPNFLVNNISFGNNSDHISQCIAFYDPLQVGLNTPVTFTSTTTGGGDPNNLSYSWEFDSHNCEDKPSSFTAVPSNSSVRGPVEVYYTTTGYKEVSLSVINAREIKPEILAVTKGLGKGRCFATLGNATVSSTCWSTSKLPKFSIPVLKSNCPVAKTEVTYWTNGVGNSAGYVLPNGVLDFTAMGIPVPIFPLTADFSFTVYQFDGVSYNFIGYKTQRFTIYGPVTADAGLDRQVCLGGSVVLGAGTSQNSYDYSYSWASPTITSAINFLSSNTDANPVFLGTQKGTYTYSLTLTNIQTGCKSLADNVTVIVDRPEVASKYYAIAPGSASIAVTAPGGFGSNTFSWTPAANLSAVDVINPTFTSNQDGTFNYDVSVTDKLGCSSTGLVIVEVSTAPAYLTATPKAYSKISLTWTDRSTTETGFLIQRSTDGTAFSDYATVAANVTSFDDFNVQPGTTYYYQVAIQLSGSVGKFSNVASADTQSVPPFTPMGSDISKVFGTMIDFDNDNDLDFAQGGTLYRNDNGVYVAMPLPANLYYYIAADFDNDNDLDLLAPWFGSMLRNDHGTFVLTQLGIKYTGARANANWTLPFDYDRDNDVDVLTADGSFKIGLNAGNTFSDVDTGIPVTIPGGQWPWGGYERAFTVGDVDNDGLEDIVTGNYATQELQTIVFPNTGHYSTSNSTVINNKCCVGGSMGLLDFDSDSKLDLFANATSSYLLKNQGNLTFSNTNNSFKNQTFPSCNFGDLDMDGDLDIVYSEEQNYLESGGTRIYQNTDGTFSGYFSDVLSHNLSEDLDCADIDGDGDLDIVGLFVNSMGTNKYSSNTRPLSPSQTCSYIDGEYAILSWNRGDDAETPSLGLTYNLYVIADGKMIMSPLADIPTGFRKVVKRGNVDQNTTWRIYVGNATNIVWGVQSIDNSYIGSAFSNAIMNVTQYICGDLMSSTYRGINLLAGYSCSTTIAAGVNANFEAAKDIKLGPGFRVPLGGAFDGKVLPVTSNPCASIASGSRVGHTSNSGAQQADVSPEIITSPNPGSGIFNISSDLLGTYDQVEISICLVSGEPILTRSYQNVSSISDNFDISQYPSGVYFMKVSFGSQVKYYRVIKI